MAPSSGVVRTVPGVSFMGVLRVAAVRGFDRGAAQFLPGGHVPADQLSIAIETFRATVEGAFAKRLDKPARRRVLRYVLERLTA